MFYAATGIAKRIRNVCVVVEEPFRYPVQNFCFFFLSPLVTRISTNEGEISLPASN